MPEPRFLSLLNSTTLLSDGAMGTMLHSRGVSFEYFKETTLDGIEISGLHSW
jgi:methionine synthase I (cobalamin-dependent)